MKTRWIILLAAPMVGGVVTSLLLELMVYPVIYYLWKGWTLRNEAEREGRALANQQLLSRK